MREAFDDGSRDHRRIWSVAPHSLECRVAGSEVLALDDEDVPLHDVLRPGTSGCQRRAQVAQDLLGLCGDVADADDVPLAVDCVLAADVDRPDAARDDSDVAERRVPGRPSGLRNSTRPSLAVEACVVMSHSPSCGGDEPPPLRDCRSAPWSTSAGARTATCRRQQRAP